MKGVCVDDHTWTGRAASTSAIQAGGWRLTRADTNLDGQFDETTRRIRDLIDALKPTATAVDSSLDKAVEAAQTRIENALTRLEKMTIRAEKRNQQVILERLERPAVELTLGWKQQALVV